MLSALVVLLGAHDVAVELPAGPKPTLDFSRPVACLACLSLKPSKLVPSGEYRVQCEPSTRTCYAAPKRVLITTQGGELIEGEEPLSRVSDVCTSYIDGVSAQSLARQEWRFELAIPEAPPGWYRDERGRVMQVNFDLGRRIFVGGAWAPFYRPDLTGSLARARVEFGISITLNSGDQRHQHRLHFLETTALLGNTPLATRFEASVARYDVSSHRQRAPLWLTTFIGAPRRFDLPLNLGWAAEAARFESLGGKNYLTIAELDVTVDLWNSAELDSFIRLRAGPSLEYDFDAKGAYFKPVVALEADLTLDRDGFHHVTASATGEKLFWEPMIEGRGVSPQRLRIKAGYEVILFALNDYPFTLTLDDRANWRDDVPALEGWEFTGNVGLRFSLWAPARHQSTQVRTRPAYLPPPPVANPPAPKEKEEETPPPPQEKSESNTQKLIKAAVKALASERPPTGNAGGGLERAPQDEKQ